MTHADYEAMSRVVAESLRDETHWLDEMIDRQARCRCGATHARAKRAAEGQWSRRG